MYCSVMLLFLLGGGGGGGIGGMGKGMSRYNSNAFYSLCCFLGHGFLWKNFGFGTCAYSFLLFSFIQITHPKAIELLFHEAYHNYISGLYPCKDQDVILFATLLFCIRFPGNASTLNKSFLTK